MVIDGGHADRLLHDAVRSSAAVHRRGQVRVGHRRGQPRPRPTRSPCLRELGISVLLRRDPVREVRGPGAVRGLPATSSGSEGCDTVEISNGTIPLSNTGKAAYIRKCAERVHGRSARSASRTPGGRSGCRRRQWVDCIGEDLDAGASMVITEARRERLERHLPPRRRAALRSRSRTSCCRRHRLRPGCCSRHPTRPCRPTSSPGSGPTSTSATSPLDQVDRRWRRCVSGLRADTLMHFEAGPPSVMPGPRRDA